MLTVDITFVGLNNPAVISLLLKLQHCSIAIDSCSASASPLGQRLSQVSGLNIAIIWVLYGANNALDIGHGPSFFDLLRSQKVNLNTDGLGHT